MKRKQTPAHKAIRHPVQPIEWDGNGVLRFKANPIVVFLLAHSGKAHNLTDLHRISEAQGFTSHDWDQFHQLLGYSVAGCPLNSRVTIAKAAEKQASYVTDWPADPARDRGAL